MELLGFDGLGRLTTRTIAISLAVALLFGTAGCQSGSPTLNGTNGWSNATVVEVIDGDTVRLRFESGEEIVRLLGVDTPETVDPNRPAQCFGAEASTFLSQLLPQGTAVLAVRDAQTRDVFGRLLAYVFVDSAATFVNLELLRNGFADTLSIEPNTTYRSSFAAALRQAKSNRVGLWASCDSADQPLGDSERDS